MGKSSRVGTCGAFGLLPEQGCRKVGQERYTITVSTAWGLCLEHLDQIKEALRIGGVKTNAHAWRGTSSQIDLLIDRNDGIVNLCEMKYHDGRYPITKDDDDAMRNKKSEFKEETETRKAVHVTYITPFGIKDNVYARNVQSSVVLDDLFAF